MFLYSIIKAWGDIFAVYQNTKEKSAKSIIMHIPNISQSLSDIGRILLQYYYHG